MMTTSATISKNSSRRHAPRQRDGPWNLGIAKRGLTIAVFVMIAALPATGAISTTDAARYPSVLMAHLARYQLVLYSPPHLPQTTDGLFDTRMKHPRHRFMQSVLFYCKFGKLARRLASYV